MQRTVSSYKLSILTMKTDLDNILAKINYFHFNDRETLIKEIEKYQKSLHQILAIRRQKNTREIALILERAIHHRYLTAPLKTETFEKKILAAKQLPKET